MSDPWALPAQSQSRPVADSRFDLNPGSPTIATGTSADVGVRTGGWARAGLRLVMLGGLAIVLTYALDWDSTGAGTLPFLPSVAVCTAEVLCALAAAVALVKGDPWNRRLVYGLRGAAAWLLASGFSNLAVVVTLKPEEPAAGWWATIVAGGALVSGSLLILISGWHRGAVRGRLPLTATIALVVACAVGYYFGNQVSIHWHPYLIGLAVGGLLLLAAGDHPPQLFAWFGWSAVGAIHLWSIGAWFGTATSSTPEYLWNSSLGPAVVAALAVAQMSRYPDSTS